jgi:hypothetical protein
MDCGVGTQRLRGRICNALNVLELRLRRERCRPRLRPCRPDLPRPESLQARLWRSCMHGPACHARAIVRTNSSKVRPQRVASHLRQSLSRRGETFLGVRTRERDTAAAVSAVCVLYIALIIMNICYILLPSRTTGAYEHNAACAGHSDSDSYSYSDC